MSLEKLQGMGFKNVEFNTYPSASVRLGNLRARLTSPILVAAMQHSLCDAEQADIETWLRKTLPAL